MASTTTPDYAPPHVALFPTSGMGHLVPFLRLAAMLASRNCQVTFITVKPTVSASESNQLSSFFATYPHINCLEFPILDYQPSNFITGDPFFAQFAAISNSVHLLRSLLPALSPPLSAIVADFPVASKIYEIAAEMLVSSFVLTTTSARMLSLMACHTHLALGENRSEKSISHVELPGLGPLPLSSIPPPLLNPNHFLVQDLRTNSPALSKVQGILMNNFESFESETIQALKSGKVVSDLAPLFPVGPFESFEAGQGPNLPWLDNQPDESVMFISFGSRTALAKEQLRELATGLAKSGLAFLWVLKTSKVDKDDNEDLQEILGESFLKRTKNNGIVVKEWVNQDQILAHPAIGGFLSHCGWNSVMEAAKLGVPILAWPQHGDQRVNAEVVEKAGLGLWPKHWGWVGEKILVSGEEISCKIKVLMGGESLRAQARQVKERARKAHQTGGSSNQMIQHVIEMLKLNSVNRA